MCSPPSLLSSSSLYAVIQQHQTTIEQQRVKCEQSDAQYAQTANKLTAAEKEMTRLRLLLEREHDSNERHIQAQKGQLSLKTDECLALGSRLSMLEQEYGAHREQYEHKIEKLEKDRSILEAVNFELRAEKEKNYNLVRENEEMKNEILKKAFLQGQYESAQEQITTMSTTISRLEDERAAWTGERRDLDHALGEVRATLKLTTAERDASQIEAASLQRQLDAQANENMRQREAAHEGALKREHDLRLQIEERDQTHARTLQTVAIMEAEVTGLRAEQTRLLDVQASLESQLRDAAMVDEKKSGELEKVLAEKASLAAHVDQLQPQLAKSETLVKRTVESREHLVMRLDAHYLHSSAVQVFQRWKSEYRAQAEKRRALATEERVKRLQAELEELPHRHLRELEKARAEWHETVASRAHDEREEQRAREHRIAEERERIRAEVEEARRLEVEAVRAREQSMARRPSIQSLVGHVVAAALDHLPADGEHPRRRSSSRGDRRSSSNEQRPHRSHHSHDGTRKHRHHHHHHFREEPTTAAAGPSAAHSRAASPPTTQTSHAHVQPFQVVLEAHESYPVTTGPATQAVSKSSSTHVGNRGYQTHSTVVSQAASPMTIPGDHSARSQVSAAPRSSRSSISTATATAPAPRVKVTKASSSSSGVRKATKTTKTVVPPLPLEQIHTESISQMPAKSLKQSSTEMVSSSIWIEIEFVRTLSQVAFACFALFVADVRRRLTTRLVFATGGDDWSFRWRSGRNAPRIHRFRARRVAQPICR